MPHLYDIQKTMSGNVSVTCSECGPCGAYPDGEAASAFVIVHDRQHAVARNATTPTQAAINDWLAGPDQVAWEPTAEERSGHVAVPLGHVAVDEAITKASAHPSCPANPDDAAGHTTLRILDERGKVSDHDLELGDMLLSCVVKELNADPRVATVWYVKQREVPEHLQVPS